MEEEDIYIPRDVIRSILSYDSYPRFRLVSREFDMAEQELEEERIQRVKDLYPNPVDTAYDRDWKALIFILKHPRSFYLTSIQLKLIINRIVKDDKMNIVKIVLDRGYNPLDIAISATINDRMDILIYLMENYNIYMLDHLADLAAKYDHIHILQYMLEHGATNYYRITTDYGERVRDWMIKHYPLEVAEDAIINRDDDLIYKIRDTHPKLVSEIDKL